MAQQQCQICLYRTARFFFFLTGTVLSVVSLENYSDDNFWIRVLSECWWASRSWSAVMSSFSFSARDQHLWYFCRNTMLLTVYLSRQVSGIWEDLYRWCFGVMEGFRKRYTDVLLLFLHQSNISEKVNMPQCSFLSLQEHTIHPLWRIWDAGRERRSFHCNEMKYEADYFCVSAK